MTNCQVFHAAVLAALGHAPDVIEPGRLHRFATSDQRHRLAHQFDRTIHREQSTHVFGADNAQCHQDLLAVI